MITSPAADIAYASALLDGMPVRLDHASAAAIVSERRRMRDVMQACNLLAAMAEDNVARADAIVEQAIERFSEIGFEIRNAADKGVTYAEASIQLMKSLSEERGPQIFTDIREVDDLTGGFLAGELIIFTAETGVGKTLLAQQTRRRACRDGFHTLYCSGEMFARHLVSRELSAQAGVKPWKMRQPDRITPQEFTALMEVIQHQCSKCRILDGDLTLLRIRRAARQMKKNIGLDFVVIDYDELVEVPGKDENEQLKNLTREAKSMAMELFCPVVLISQLRKALQGEDRRHPTLQRLYGSGAKGKHSSIVLYVDRQYVQDLDGDETAARIAILKSRDGRVGQIPAFFDVQRLQFFSVVPDGKGIKPPY